MAGAMRVSIATDRAVYARCQDVPSFISDGV